MDVKHKFHLTSFIFLPHHQRPVGVVGEVAGGQRAAHQPSQVLGGRGVVEPVGMEDGLMEQGLEACDLHGFVRCIQWVGLMDP